MENQRQGFKGIFKSITGEPLKSRNIKDHCINKIDTSKVRDLEFFTTHNNINGFFTDILVNQKSEISNNVKVYSLFKEYWSSEVVESINKDISKETILNKFSFLKESNIGIEFRNDKTLNNAFYEPMDIDITSSIVLAMALLRDKDIHTAINSEEFASIINIRFLHALFAKKYFTENKEKLSHFVEKLAKDNVVDLSDFDCLSLITWKTARDFDALDYAYKSITPRNKKTAKKIAGILKASYLEAGVSQLASFTDQKV